MEPPALQALLDELQPLEPIFHTAAFGTSLADFEGRMAADYWETGASGRRYSRVFILQHLQREPPALAADLGWVCSDFALRSLGAETLLLAAVTQAPLMAAAMAAELTGHGSLLPLLIPLNYLAAVISRALSSHALHVMASEAPTSVALPPKR